MLAVYRVKRDPLYKPLLAANPEEIWIENATGARRFTGRTLTDDWEPLALKRPFHGETPSFWGFDNTFVFDTDINLMNENQKRADAKIDTIVHGCGEFLPVFVDEHACEAMHITYVIDALDRGQSIIDTSANGVNIVEYAFHKNRLFETGYTLFKIVETHEIEILTLHGFGVDPEIDFKTVYDNSGFTGLVFEELYRWDED